MLGAMGLCQGVFGRLRLQRGEGGARHLLPNALPPVIVVVTMVMGAIAGAEVVLSWLGIGIQHPVPSLGSMIREGQDVSILRNQPHLILPPVVVGLLVFAWNLLGDALNDVLNPRSR